MDTKRRLALALVIAVTCVLVPIPHAGAAPLPGAWCGPDEKAVDRPDVVAQKQIHVIYAYPQGAIDRFREMSGAIVRDLAGVDTWWRSQDPTRSPRFDFADFPGCDSEFGALDVSSLQLTHASDALNVADGAGFADSVGDDLSAAGFTNMTKKYLVFYDGPGSNDLCGRSASNSVVGGPRLLAVVFLQSGPGCEVGGYGTGNGWPAHTAAHELIHALNDFFVFGGAPHACDDRAHVCDSNADIISTGSTHPSARLSDAILDVGHDDYYDHPGTWWDVRDSTWLMHLESPPGALSVVAAGLGGRVSIAPAGRVCPGECVQRYDGGTAVTLTATVDAGYRLLAWGGACSGSSDTCDTTVNEGGTTVSATFGPAVKLDARVVGPGSITWSDGAPCLGDCSRDLIPGAKVRLVAQPEARARFADGAASAPARSARAPSRLPSVRSTRNSLRCSNRRRHRTGGPNRVAASPKVASVKRRVLIRRLLSVLLLTVVITSIAWVGLSAQVFGGFQRRATDALFPGAPTDKHVAVVGIDRKAISALNDPLPWPRSRMADLTNRLSEAGAAVIVFDLVFSQPSPQGSEADDIAFEDAIKRAGNVVFGEGVTNARAQKGGLPPLALEGTNVYQGFAENAAGVGHVQVNQDPSDGVVRSISLVFDTESGTFLPALSLAAVMKLRGVHTPLIVRPNGVVAGNRFIPSGSETSMVLNFSEKLSDPTSAISALDVLNGTLDPSRVAGKIVFIGATDPLSGDVRLAPTNKSSRLPGVFLHANAANTMLTGTYLHEASDATTLMWVALLTALVALLVVMLPFWLSPVLTLLLTFGFLVLVVARFDAGTINNIIYPLVAIAVSFLGAVVLRYFGETRQRRRVTALFSQYVPETVAQRLVDEDRAETAAEGQRLDMTVLFCDLRGFTALSESLSPATVRVMLDHYYDRVTELVLAMRGTLMKYVGDEVFAVWGAPIPTSDHPAQALACAIAIQELTPQLNRELLERGAPEVSFGIGLNTGEAVAAYFGGRRRRQYDVVGDTVNVGARLCSTAGRGEIILSDQVLTRVPSPPPVEPVGHVELKGVSRELRLWRVVTSDSGTLAQSADTLVGHDAGDAGDSASEATGEAAGGAGGARVGAGEGGG